MKQILQNLRTGEMLMPDLPCAPPTRGAVRIQTQKSLISAGTERMLVEFSQANLLQKARQQPEKVKQVLDKIRTDGLMPTLETVFRKLDEPMPLGYCNVGIVTDVGPGVSDLCPGDLVANNGPHAEIVCVPQNLCAKVPQGVAPEDAAFTVLGSIALQGIRLVAPTLGERIVVFGLGLVGLMTVRLLRANGCNVLGVDLNPNRLKLAQQSGAAVVDAASGADPIAAAAAWTEGQGVDGVIVTAAAKTDEIMHQAAEMCRQRGRIVLVGVVGLNLRRSDFYKKELTFQVSCSYGPGRYDEKYEQGGQDYPEGFVRWTEQRNFQAVLSMMESGRLPVSDLITDRIPFPDAISAYDKVQHDRDALGIVLEYGPDADLSPQVTVKHPTARQATHAAPRVGVIGAGGFAKGILLPALSKTPAKLVAIADIDAAAAQHAAAKFGAEKAVSDYRLILEDRSVEAVFILVGHHLHAKFVCDALDAGKHVLVEKPLAIDRRGLDLVKEKMNAHPDLSMMIGFNRRFSPHTVRMLELLKGRTEPLCMTMTVNSGAIPADHWTQDMERGGGRIIGEGCHFLDLLSYLAGSPIEKVASMMVGRSVAVRGDKISVVLTCADGSVGTLNYFANGSKSYPKEQLEVFTDGRVLSMENFRVTRGYGFRGFKKYKTPRQNKGHEQEVAAFIRQVATGGSSPIPFEELVRATEASFAVVESAQGGQVVDLAHNHGAPHSVG